MEEKILIEELTQKMEGSIKVLDHDLVGLRTGRASIHFLDPVQVDAYGSRVPVSNIGTISTPDSRTIAVQVWDAALTKSVEKAISEANLGITPSIDGKTIRLSMPILSQDRRKDLVKLAHKYGENAKIAIRNNRRSCIDSLRPLEKAGKISEDELHNLSDKVQKLTDKYIEKVDSKVKEKESEIMTI
jgi:ribosome recycling factor